MDDGSKLKLAIKYGGVWKEIARTLEQGDGNSLYDYNVEDYHEETKFGEKVQRLIINPNKK